MDAMERPIVMAIDKALLDQLLAKREPPGSYSPVVA